MQRANNSFSLYLGFSILSIAIYLLFLRNRSSSPHISLQTIIFHIVLVVGGILANYANLMLPTFVEIPCLAKVWILFVAWPLIYGAYATRILVTVISLRCSVRMSRKPSRAMLTDDFPRPSEVNNAGGDAEVGGPCSIDNVSWPKQAAAVLGPLGVCHLALPIILTVVSGELREITAPFCRETDLASVLLIVLHAFYILFLFPAALFFLRRYGGRRHRIGTEVAVVVVSMFCAVLLPIILRKATSPAARNATLLLPSASYTTIPLFLMLLVSIIIPLFQAIFLPGASRLSPPSSPYPKSPESTRSRDARSIHSALKMSVTTIGTDGKEMELPSISSHLSSTPDTIWTSVSSSPATLVEGRRSDDRISYKSQGEVREAPAIPPMPVRSRTGSAASSPPGGGDTISTISGGSVRDGERAEKSSRIASFMPGGGNRSRTGLGGTAGAEVRTAHFEGLLKNRKTMEGFKVFAAKQRCGGCFLFSMRSGTAKGF
ncbi:hypothetical protein HK097_004408 [Rhizophlyctis rosea]|uniref:Uncharacterized protein n=1 Tax=Rhizophlyctis rosea TaxID=64517 RepID=A0AAD5X036_9FUNG|nr:hypothetical protein HK097_004408 [Rhizophlyctis rosea]